MADLETTINIPIDDKMLEGTLMLPDGATGIVLFAHGSGSSRFSPRNQYVARFLAKSKLAALLVDLLTSEEGELDEMTRALRFDIPLLTDRLLAVTNWLQRDPRTATMRIGFFGASTGAAAALLAAAKLGLAVSAVVSRGGRADLALPQLVKVQAPTLLIVGAHDYGVIELNEQAYHALSCKKKLVLVPKATHLFEEPGALEEVARLAAEWFEQNMKMDDK